MEDENLRLISEIVGNLPTIYYFCLYYFHNYHKYQQMKKQKKAGCPGRFSQSKNDTK